MFTYNSRNSHKENIDKHAHLVSYTTNILWTWWYTLTFTQVYIHVIQNKTKILVWSKGIQHTFVERALAWAFIHCTISRVSSTASTTVTSIFRRWIRTGMRSPLGPTPTCHRTSSPLCPFWPSTMNWTWQLTTHKCIANSVDGRTYTIHISNKYKELQ